MSRPKRSRPFRIRTAAAARRRTPPPAVEALEAVLAPNSLLATISDTLGG